jgi:hypothetical protein
MDSYFSLDEKTLNEKVNIFNSCDDNSVKRCAFLANKLLEKEIENLKLRQKINVLLYELSLK